MPSAAELQVVVGADVSQAESKLSSFGSGLGAALGVGVAAAGAAIAAGVAVGVKAAGDLQQSVANISTIKPEIDTSAVFASLNEMSTRIPQTASQLGESLYNVFSSVNVTAEQGLQLVETFAKGAVGAGTSAETFGTAAMGVMNAYGLSVSDAAHISDVFFNTVNAGVVTGEELAASLGPVTQSAKAAGVSLDELGAMIVGVTKEGGPAAQNINNLNNLLQKVTTKEAQKGMNDLGVATKTATGDFRPTIEVMRDLKTHLAGMTESARAAALQTIFPDAQARIGALTIMSQIDAVDAALETNKTAVGSTASAYEKMSATFNSQSKLLVNGLMAILTTVGAMLLPAITPLITAFATSLPAAFESAKAALAPFAAMIGGVLTEAARQAGDAFRTIQQVFAGEWAPSASIDPFVNAIGQIAIVVRDQIVPALTTFMGILGQVGTFLAAHLEIVAGVAAGFAAFMVISTVIPIVTALGAALAFLLSPIGLVVAAVALLTAAWVGNWGGIQEITASAMAMVSSVISTGLAAIQGFWDAHGAAIMAAVTTAWTVIQTAISAAIAIVGALITAAQAAWAGDWDTAWAALSAATSVAWELIKSVVDVALTALGALFAPAWEAIKATVQTALDTIGITIQAAWDGITTQVSAAMLAIQAAIKAVWDLIPEDIRADLVLIATHLVTSGAEWVTSVTTTALAIWTAITTKFTEIANAVLLWASVTIMTPLNNLIVTATKAATDTGTGIWTAITGKLAEVVNAVMLWASVSVMTPLNNLIVTARNAAASIGQGIIDGIRGAIEAGANAIASAAADVVRRAIAAAKSAVGVGGSDGERAAGGPVRAGGMYLVGERGPEMFMPGTAGMIVPNSALRATGGYGGGGGSFETGAIVAAIARLEARLSAPSITVNGVGLDEVAAEIERRQQRQLSLRGGRY